MSGNRVPKVSKAGGGVEDVTRTGANVSGVYYAIARTHTVKHQPGYRNFLCLVATCAATRHKCPHISLVKAYLAEAVA